MILSIDKINNLTEISKGTLKDQNNAKWADFLNGVCDYLQQFEDIKEYEYLPRHDFEMEFNRNLNKLVSLGEKENDDKSYIYSFGYNAAEEICKKVDLKSKMRQKCSISDLIEEYVDCEQSGNYMDGFYDSMSASNEWYKDWKISKEAYNNLWRPCLEAGYKKEEKEMKDAYPEIGYMNNAEFFNKAGRAMGQLYELDNSLHISIGEANYAQILNIISDFCFKQRCDLNVAYEILNVNKTVESKKSAEKEVEQESPKRTFNAGKSNIIDLTALEISLNLESLTAREIKKKCVNLLLNAGLTDEDLSKTLLLAIRKEAEWSVINFIEDDEKKEKKQSLLKELYTNVLKDINL